jgi:hypothetical protein
VLTRAIEGGVNRWSVHHGAEVGGCSAWQRSTGSRRKKGVTPPPSWASWALWAAQTDWAKSQGRILLNLNRIFGNLHKEI